MRYNRAFKRGMVAIVFCILLFGSIVTLFVASKIQYDRLVSHMKPLEAVIVDIDLDVHIKGPDEQEIYIEYAVDGIVYKRKLETDTAISFEAGRGAQYSIGDKVQIFYDPQNPEIIASPRSIGVGAFFAIIALLGLALVLYVLVKVLKNRRSYLITEEAYAEEGEALRGAKREARVRKKNAHAERAKGHPMRRKVAKILCIVLGSGIGAFALYILLGLLLLSLRG